MSDTSDNGIPTQPAPEATRTPSPEIAAARSSLVQMANWMRINAITNLVLIGLTGISVLGMIASMSVLSATMAAQGFPGFVLVFYFLILLGSIGVSVYLLIRLLKAQAAARKAAAGESFNVNLELFARELKTYFKVSTIVVYAAIGLFFILMIVLVGVFAANPSLIQEGMLERLRSSGSGIY